MVLDTLFSQIIALKILTAYSSAALFVLDERGFILEAIIPDRAPAKLVLLKGKNFTRLARLILREKAFPVIDRLNCVMASKKDQILQRFHHVTLHNLQEYFDWNFLPLPGSGGCCMVLVKKVTDNVLLEQEFFNVAQQAETVNCQLLSAMSELDFKLMDLDQAYKKLQALYNITSIVQKTVNVDEILNYIVRGITRELGFENAAIFLIDETKNQLVMKAHQGYADDICIDLGKGVTGYAAVNRELVYVPDITRDSRYISGTKNGASEVAIPLIVNDKVIGILDVESSNSRQIQPYDLELLKALASQAALTIAHAAYVTEVQRQAITDELTGLYNYRYCHNILAQEFKRTSRYNHPLSLLMIDIDFFKHFNDTYGHSAGNQVLKDVSDIIRQNCRDVDIVTRYGGEEFAVILPETLISEAIAVAERIRLGVAQHLILYGQMPSAEHITVSIGVSGYPVDAFSPIELIKHADAALYQAKRSTKNCVCTYI